MMDGQGRSDRFSKEIPPPMREISIISRFYDKLYTEIIPM